MPIFYIFAHLAHIDILAFILEVHLSTKVILVQIILPEY